MILGGVILASAAYALFLPLGADWTYTAMLPTFLALSVAFALAYGPLTIAATDGVDDDEQGLAGGVLTTSFQFGSALGLAVVAAVLVGAGEPGASAEPALDGFRSALVVPLVATVLGVIVMASGMRRRAAAGDPEPRRETVVVSETTI